MGRSAAGDRVRDRERDLDLPRPPRRRCLRCCGGEELRDRDRDLRRRRWRRWAVSLLRVRDRRLLRDPLLLRLLEEDVVRVKVSSFLAKESNLGHHTHTHILYDVRSGWEDGGPQKADEVA